MSGFTLALLKVDTLYIENPVRYFDSLYYYGNIHVYDFHDDAGHHHGSQ